MRYIRQYYETLLLLILLWCVLSESFSPDTLGAGLFFSLVTIIIIRLLFSDNDHVKNYRISPILFLRYVAVLICQIIISSLAVSKAVLTGKCNPKVVEIHTSVNNHWFQCIIANSITLTPGTVTVDKTDHTLQVLWLCPTTEDPKEMANCILGPFEKVLMKGDVSK